MKKIIIIIMFFALNANAFSVDSTLKKAKESTISAVQLVDSSSNFKMIYGDIKSGISAMAASLKVTADHVYGILVMQQRVRAIVWLCLLIMSVWFVWAFSRGWARVSEKWTVGTGRDENPTFMGVFRWAQCVIGIVVFIIAIFNIDVIVMGFLNPEYGAIKDIMDMVKDK